MGSDSRRMLMLALARLTCLRPGERFRLARVWQSPADLVRCSWEQAGRLLERRLQERSWRPAAALRSAEQDHRWLGQGGRGALFRGEAGYPERVSDIYDPPLVLFYRGEIGALAARPSVAVVGTRLPTGGGREAAWALGAELAAHGCAVISGLARGIDKSAHGGCCEVGGTAVAVLGSGVDLIYPRGSASVARDILASGGLILSEYGPGTPPRRHQFPARNRIISALADATVVVQAPHRSGALITADYALEHGRELYVHRAGLLTPAGAGTLSLAEQGAPVVDGGSQVVAWLARLPGRDGAAAAAAGKPLVVSRAGVRREEAEGGG